MIISNRDLTPEGCAEYIEAPAPVILEIGCNDGTDTNRFLKAFPSAHVYCFEPDPRAVTRFRQTVNDDRATLIEAALSDNDGRAIFHGSAGQPPARERGPAASHYCHLPEWDLSGSLCQPTGHLGMSPWVTFPEERRFEVETIRLDTWTASKPELTRIDFVWADVQGAEGLLLRGATQALPLIDALYIETRAQGGRMKDRELYAGQPTLDQLRVMLPGFTLLATHGDNALFKRLT